MNAPPTAERIKVRAHELLVDDRLCGSGGVVLIRPRRVLYPSRPQRIELTVTYPDTGRVRTVEWGANTTMTIERDL